MSWAMWITGVPGSGKSVLAQAVAAELRARGEPVRVLEMDEIARALTPEPRGTDAEREVIHRALGYTASLLTELGVPVIIDAAAHRRAWRDLARASIPRFAEVHVSCPPDVALERAQGGSGAPSGGVERGGPARSTARAVDLPYEPPLAPELVIESASESVPHATQRIVALARHLAADSAAELGPRALGWAIWITGRPGSGKTTVAVLVAETLEARAIPLRVLDLPTARQRLLPYHPGSEAEHEIVCRALAYAAKLLTEAGIAVLIDATAERRAWRELARELIPRFAEVQLLCPSPLCAERERAARWGLGGEARHAPRPAHAPEPDIVLDYEESLRPDLVVRTDVGDPRSAAEAVLALIGRLHHTVTASI